MSDIEIACEVRARTTKALCEAAQAAIAYDDAIQSCADDPVKMSSFCTAKGDTLDALYGNWISAARAALHLAREKGLI